MLTLRKTLELARSLLNDEKIQFALIGGFALGAHGIVRATRDIDLLVDGTQKDRVKKAFIAQGFNVIYESTEVLQLSGPGFVDIIFANRPLSIEMIRESHLELAGVPVVSVESLVGLKIQAFKNDPSRTLQDKADIQALLKLPGINLTQVKKYADLFDVWSEIEELMKWATKNFWIFSISTGNYLVPFRPHQKSPSFIKWSTCKNSPFALPAFRRFQKPVLTRADGKT